MLNKVKNWLGIEGAKVVIELTSPFDLKTRKICGKIRMSSKTEQYVESLHFKLVEKYTRGRRKNKLIDEYTLGERTQRILKLIEAEGDLVIPFELDFEIMSSAVDNFGDRNPVYRGITNVAKLIKNANSEFYLICEAQIKGTALHPYHRLVLN